MTPQEIRLWGELRHLNRRGYHFRRQAPVDGYVLDFAEFSHRLIVEADGWQHGEADGKRKDTRRDAHFTAAGFRVLRFWNNDIDSNMNGVVLTILDALTQPPPPPLRGGPSPQRGREK